MIRKIASIQNMAVFSDFKWDNSVKDASGNVQYFQQVNVMYGRNYSGKTTLSRIMRAFETGVLSDKYGHPAFTLVTEDATYTEENYPSNPFLIRVFNEDFIRENLRFVVDPSEAIAPFAILGEDNDRIEKQIEQICLLLGTNEAGAETGLYQKRAAAYKAYQDAKTQRSKAESELNKHKNAKATDRDIGIKYHSERFGNQNYTIRSLEADIAFVLSDDYIRPSDEQIVVYEQSITETAMTSPQDVETLTFSIEHISEIVKEICSRKVGQSNKIQELLSDIALQEWVHQGLAFNKGRERCAFCGSPLSDTRWTELFSHFDKESEQLRKDIEDCLNSIDIEEKRVREGFPAKKEEFYASFSVEVDSLVKRYEIFAEAYIKSLGELRALLKARKDSIHTTIEYEYNLPNLVDYSLLVSEYGNLRKKSIAHSDSIDSSRKEAQKQLRLAEVATFVKTVGYAECDKQIKALADAETAAQIKLSGIDDEIHAKLSEVDSLRRQQNDEEKGAIRVNKLLQLYFGHRYLAIVSKEPLN